MLFSPLLKTALRSSSKPSTTITGISSLTSRFLISATSSAAVRRSACVTTFRSFQLQTRRCSSVNHSSPVMSTSNTSRQQPPWKVPQSSTEVPKLHLYNSMTRTKTEFIPMDGNQVKWYACGPTVYDSTHIGHARNYVTLDIMHRIIEDYFNYNVLFVENITDIDDKIIKRARQNYLFDNYKAATTTVNDQVIAKATQAWNLYAESEMAKVDPLVLSNWKAFTIKVNGDAAFKAGLAVAHPKFPMHFTALTEALGAIESAQKNAAGTDAAAFCEANKTTLSVLLDKELSSTVTDPKVFRDLAAFWEGEFFKDMDTLGVRRPDILTRVSEYVPEIVEYVEKIIANGYAYEAEGSVYFDTAAFDGKNGHHYAKLAPWSKGDAELMEESEGSLGIKLSGKKSSMDFALWKASKEGEPSWPSPWGKGGRPGWHIECSVMASEVLGSAMDIHSGGIDLAFPHHDNELAQSEAYHQCDQWVNYFTHCGHLHVEGQKMSKSLKNFITVQQALEKYTPRQLRYFFLRSKWDNGVDFRESGMAEAIGDETFFDNFFANSKAIILEAKHTALDSNGTHRYRKAEIELIEALNKHQGTVHAALCDSIDTPEAMKQLRSLVTEANRYINLRDNLLNADVVAKVTSYVSKMLRTFGLSIQTSEPIGLGEAGGAGSVSIEEVALPYVQVLSAFRDAIRALAKAPESSMKDILKLSDEVRDVDLEKLGVSLDDRDDGKALVKFIPAEKLAAARQEKLAKAAEKARAAADRAAKVEQDRLAALEKGKLSHLEMFKNEKDEEGKPAFGSFNEDGIPQTNGAGEELPKSKTKKLIKDWTAQKKLHEKYLASLQ